MSKSKVGKCRKTVRDYGGYEPWFRKRRARNRRRDEIAKASRRINRRRR